MPVFKKRPKGFKGTPRQHMPPAGSSSSSSRADEATSEARPVAEAPVERPVPIETASSKKLAMSLPCPSSGRLLRDRTASQPSTSNAGEPEEDPRELKGYRLISCEGFSQAVSEIGLCSACHSPLTLKEDLTSRRGLVSKLTICCTNTACNKEAAVSDPFSRKTETSSKALNLRSVMGMREIGKGLASLEYFCGLMDMLPPVTSHAYNELNSSLSDASKATASDNMRAASAYLHHLRGADPDTVLDIAVTCDGTWSKRGHTATHGVVVVIAWETGQVLDFEILTKRCTPCSVRIHKWGEKSKEFEEWYEGHKSSCTKTHTGSSPAMECEGAVRIWSRSESTLHLRFTEVISDGDAKTIAALNESKPYGEDVTIIKHECVGHVQKRLGKRFRDMKHKVIATNKNPKGKVKELKDHAD